ncbi:MAG: transcription termination/antitermination protein NusA, partial [Bacteroidaceae bacterium]|nr:transcription termination/antitermination protein NusA [Bacteroidaceae bacterium]
GEEDDIYLYEFSDEIDQWVIDAFNQAGMKTAREVLSHTREELIQMTDLEEDTIDDVLNILNEEFEKE